MVLRVGVVSRRMHQRCCEPVLGLGGYRADSRKKEERFTSDETNTFTYVVIGVLVNQLASKLRAE